MSEYGAYEKGLKQLLQAKEFAQKYNPSLADCSFYLQLSFAYSRCSNYQKAAEIIWQLYQADKSDETILIGLHELFLRTTTGENDKNLSFAWLCHEKRFLSRQIAKDIAVKVSNKHQLLLNDYEKFGRTSEFLKGKKICLIYQQGMGDTIMYLRFLPHIASIAKEILIALQPPLQSLFNGFLEGKFTNVKCVCGQNVDLKGYDYTMPFCTLPLFFAKDKIAKPLMLKEKYRAKKLQKIGIFWKTEDHRDAKWGDNGESRSFELRMLLEALKGYELYSFQVSPNEEEKALFKEHNITDLGSEFGDFKDTFDAFGRIDFLICADTAIAHLALSAGVETAVLLPNVFDWRWGRYEEPKSPWYDDALLFACDYENDWHSAVKKLKKYLNSRI